MTVLYGNNYIPAKVESFSLKVRLMIDRRDFDVTIKKLQSNVIQFPSSPKQLEKATSRLYLKACQQLLCPVRHFFYEEGNVTLDDYLSKLKEIEGHYINNTQADEQLSVQERQHLQVDVINLQAAGFEHTNELYPEVLMAYGDQLVTRHLSTHYGENNEALPELKKAYADVKGMIEQAKLMMNPSSRPTLR